MTTQYRSTQFGRLMRVFSRNKWFQYPDEADPLLWQSFTKQSAASSDKEHALLDGGAENQGVSRDNVAEENIILVDWYGPDDPEASPDNKNPQNWSPRWKLFVVGQICIMNFTFYIASSIYTPGELSIMKDFGVSVTVATLGLSLFSLGYGMGPMLWSPLSEIPRIGRSSIYFFTTLAFVLLQLPTGYAVNMPLFLVFRWLTGFVGSPALATGGATISDIYSPAQVVYGVAFWGSFGICGPVFGPLLGGYSAQAEGWRITIWIVAWLAAPTTILLFFCMPETSAAAILYERAQRLRKATGDHRLRSQSELDAHGYTMRDHLRVLGRAFTLTFGEPVVFFSDLYTALVYGVLFTWFESFPFVFGDIYHFNIGAQGLVFLGLFVATIIALPAYLTWLRLGVVPKISKPDFRPEMLIPPTFVGAVALPICLFWYGWSSRASVYWIVPLIGSSLFTISIVTLFFPILNYLGVAYPRDAASVFAGNGLFRATFGAVFPLFARQLFERLGVGPGNSLLAGISICFIPLPCILYWYGPNLRRMSKNAQHDS